MDHPVFSSWVRQGPDEVASIKSMLGSYYGVMENIKPGASDARTDWANRRPLNGSCQSQQNLLCGVKLVCLSYCLPLVILPGFFRVLKFGVEKLVLVRCSANDGLF